MSEQEIQEEGTTVEDTGHLQLPSRHISKPEASLSCMLSNLQLPQHWCRSGGVPGQPYYCELRPIVNTFLGQTNKPDALLFKAESPMLEAGESLCTTL